MDKPDEARVSVLREGGESAELAPQDGTREDQRDELGQVEEASILRKFTHAIAGDEERRFLTGSVLVPLLITAITIIVGAAIAANYQDWQDRRARIRDTIDGTREATTKLSTSIETLAQQGSAVERIRSKQTVLEEIRAVDEALLMLTGRAKVLTKNPDFSSSRHLQGELMSGIGDCKQKVDSYAGCLVKALSTAPVATTEDKQPCTTAFRKAIAEEGSCKSLESTAYSIAY
jgi:hypothetical protein